MLRFAQHAEKIIALATSADFRRSVALVKLTNDAALRLWVMDLDTGIERTIQWERAHPPAIDPKLFDYAAEDAVIKQFCGTGIPAGVKN